MTLIGYWHLDEEDKSEGQTAVDSSGLGNDGVYKQGDPGYGGCYTLDGVSGEAMAINIQQTFGNPQDVGGAPGGVDVVGSSDFSFSGRAPFTVDFWISPGEDQYHPPGYIQQGGVLGAWDPGAAVSNVNTWNFQLLPQSPILRFQRFLTNDSGNNDHIDVNLAQYAMGNPLSGAEIGKLYAKKAWTYFPGSRVYSTAKGWSPVHPDLILQADDFGTDGNFIRVKLFTGANGGSANQSFAITVSPNTPGVDQFVQIYLETDSHGHSTTTGNELVSAINASSAPIHATSGGISSGGAGMDYVPPAWYQSMGEQLGEHPFPGHDTKTLSGGRAGAVPGSADDPLNHHPLPLTWVNIRGTYDGDDMRLYVMGSQVLGEEYKVYNKMINRVRSTRSLSALPYGLTIGAAQFGLLFGFRTTIAAFTDTGLDEVRIWDDVVPPGFGGSSIHRTRGLP